jgi:hypothetical protein
VDDDRQDKGSSSDAIRTPWDDLPVEVRRASQGWWGEPWPSGICYDDDGRLIGEMQKPVPVGAECMGCGETIREGDRGKTCGGWPGGDGIMRPAEWHRECLMMTTVGSPASVAGMTRREEALAAWDYWTSRGWQS